MTLLEHGLLLCAGLVAGVINSVSSGGSFFTYPALLATGLSPIQAATTTLSALTPGNLAAVPEYWPEVRANRERYPLLITVVMAGGLLGIVLLYTTGADVFEDLAPWLVLTATVFFAASPAVRRWAEESAPSLTDGRLGLGLVFVLAVYLTYFGSGVGNLFLAMLTIRGFGDFLSANAAKNIIMTLGTVMATVAYSISGWIQWEPLIPVAVGSAIGAAAGSKVARRIPLVWLRAFVIAFGLFIAAWLLLR
ncbi:MAG: sulfite exporter TauE/SafE family protein [Actinomycetota bacterium]